MWIVKNNLKATLRFRGLDVSIPAGEEFDLDSMGRGDAEDSNQVQVAFEEGYLENVYKAPASQEAEPLLVDTSHSSTTQIGISAVQFDSRLSSFKDEFLSELRAQLPSLASSDSATALEEVREAISKDMQELVGELKLVRDRFASVKGRIQDDPSLSEAEVKARLAFLEEQERELLKNFETVGKQVEHDDGDVMDKADLLANL